MTNSNEDYVCKSCGRAQSKIGLRSRQLITQRDVEAIGWTRTRSGDYLCPFCTEGKKVLIQTEAANG